MKKPPEGGLGLFFVGFILFDFAAVAMHVVHYNFCRRHSTLSMTPAMAANVTRTLWSLEDLYDRTIA